MRLKIDCKGISYTITVVLMLALTISIAGAAIVMMNKQWRANSQIFQLDLSESRILVNSNSGHGQITLLIKNTGTTMAKVWQFSIGTDGNDLIVLINTALQPPLPTIFLSDTTGGTFSPSNSKVMLLGGEMIVVSGQSALITFPSTGTWNGASYFTAGKQYLVLAYPSTGEHVVSQSIVAESFGG